MADAPTETVSGIAWLNAVAPAMGVVGDTGSGPSAPESEESGSALVLKADPYLWEVIHPDQQGHR